MTTTTQLVNLPRTILGSLTTTFTAPSSCNYLGVAYVGGTMWGWQGQECQNSGDGLADAQQCWPPTTAGAAYPGTPFSGWGFYSPGLACPAGHTRACSATASGGADWAVQFTLTEGETAVGCCPTGYACTNKVSESGQTCFKLATSTVVTTGMCISSELVPGALTIPYVTTTTTTMSGESTSTATGTVETMSAWAPMVQINWKSSDLLSSGPTETGTSSTSTSSTSTSSTSTSSTSTSTTSASAAVSSSSTGSSSGSSSSSNNSGISTGAIVGAVLATVVGVLLIRAVFFLRQRKRKKKADKGWRKQQEEASKEQWQGRYGGYFANASELPNANEGPAAFEMQGSAHVVELPANTRPVEAPA